MIGCLVTHIVLRVRGTTVYDDARRMLLVSHTVYNWEERLPSSLDWESRSRDYVAHIYLLRIILYAIYPDLSYDKL